MEAFEDVLAVGGKSNSLGRAAEVIESVQADPSRLDELFDCISADDAWVRMRAVDSFEKLVREKPVRIRPYLGRIFDDLTKSSQPSVQWHLAQLFSEVELTDAQQRAAIEWLESKIKTTDVDWIVAVNVMKTLLYFYQKGAVEANEAKRLFRVQGEHSSKTVRKKAAEFELKCT